MKRGSGARRGFGAASGIVALAWLLAACAPRVDGPAAVISGGTTEQQPGSVTIRRGQTLSGIAQTYHVPMRAIAEANHLSPPYRIEAGHSLIIPDAGQSGVPPASPSVAAPPAAQPEDAALHTARQEPLAEPNRRDAATVDRPIPASLEKPSIAAVPPVASVTPAPPPTGDAIPPAAKPAPAAPASAAALEPPASNGAPAAQTRSSGAFLWPVRGHVLAPYGSGTDGTHNDGINIGAPRGTAVQVVDTGVVAYTGNELRGYGNLILVKHANGWISAYAHCDLMLVKRGEKVARGQVIARVGSTGNVSEPQLHFELRRGNHAVDPREFLAPLPTAMKDSPPD
jgi:murein DD-endopeptidase MepM/ murein hydrolase activator NlpD